MTRREACFLAAAEERAHPAGPFPRGLASERAVHAAEMRARRILRGQNGQKLPKLLEERVLALQRRGVDLDHSAELGAA